MADSICSSVVSIPRLAELILHEDGEVNLETPRRRDEFRAQRVAQTKAGLGGQTAEGVTRGRRS